MKQIYICLKKNFFYSYLLVNSSPVRSATVMTWNARKYSNFLGSQVANNWTFAKGVSESTFAYVRRTMWWESNGIERDSNARLSGRLPKKQSDEGYTENCINKRVWSKGLWYNNQFATKEVWCWSVAGWEITSTDGEPTTSLDTAPFSNTSTHYICLHLCFHSPILLL